MTKEDILFEVYGRTIAPTREVLRAMDEYAKHQSTGFGDWMKVQDCQHSAKGWVREKEDYKKVFTIGQLYSEFMRDQLITA